MKGTILFALLCTTPAAFVAAAAASPLTEHSSQRLTLHFAAAGDLKLEVRTIEGNITVVAYDGPDVEMTVDKSLSAENEEEMRAARRDVVLDTGNNAAAIHAIVRYPNQQTCGGQNGYTSRPGYQVRFDFTIRVPRAVRLQLCTINSSAVLVAGAAGDFDISNVNGRVTLTDVAGSGNARTVNGAIAATFVALPRHSSAFRTTNGDVVIALPGRPSSGLQMRTFNGHIFNDFAAAQGAATPASTVTVEKRGPDLMLETLNGDVRVLRRAK